MLTLAATLVARCVARVAVVSVALASTLVIGCSGAGSERETPPPNDARAPDVERRDATPADAGPRDGGHADVLEAADSAPRDADADTGADADSSDTFDGALWVNAGTCTLGEIGATFRGIPAYCQPSSEGTYGFYQCDELANRFMRDSLQHPDLDNVVTDYASTICERVSGMSAYSVWGPGFRPTAGLTPVPGDLVVFPGAPGHVAVVVGFSSPTELTIMQQNAGPSIGTRVWDIASSFVVGAVCWVHPESAPPAELPAGTPCGCFTGGDTCGLAIVDYEWWNGCVADVPEGGVEYGSLYTCVAGAYAKTKACPGVCITPLPPRESPGYCGK
jgi:hypothetical protein